MNKTYLLLFTIVFLSACTTTKPIITATPIPTADDLPLVEPSSTAQFSATPSALQGKASWETYEKQQNPDLSAFAGYSIQYPKSWIKKVEENPAISDFILTKGEYVITIRQAGMGAGKCNFDQNKYIEINSGLGSLRRTKGYGSTQNLTIYSICSSGENYITPTPVGLITVQAPVPENPETIAEVDAILKTLMKK